MNGCGPLAAATASRCSVLVGDPPEDTGPWLRCFASGDPSAIGTTDGRQHDLNADERVRPTRPLSRSRNGIEVIAETLSEGTRQRRAAGERPHDRRRSGARGCPPERRYASAVRWSSRLS